MITERDTDVHPPPTPSTTEPEPTLYLLKIQRACLYLGAARMATRYIKKTRGVQVRVTRCEPAIPRPDELLGYAEVPDTTFLVEVNRNDPDAIKNWAKIVGAERIDLQATTAAAAEKELNHIADTGGDPDLQEALKSEVYRRGHCWNPSQPQTSTVAVPGRGGACRYEIVGDVYPRDIWQALRYSKTHKTAGIENEVDWLAEGVVRGVTVVLSLDHEDDAWAHHVAELITEGAFTITKSAGLPAVSAGLDPEGEAKSPELSKTGSNLLLSSGQNDPTSEPSSKARAPKVKPARSKQPIPRVSAASVPEHFLGNIPDFMLVDWHWVRPTPRKRDKHGHLRRGRHHTNQGLWGLVHRLVIQQRTTTIIVPELLAAQTLWGQDKNQWPSNWRGSLERALGKVQPACPTESPMDDGPARHAHFRYPIKTLDDGPLGQTFLGALESFALRDSTGQRLYDFSEAAQSKRLKIDQDRIDEHRKTGRITSVYLPLLVFGPAKRMDLPYQQRRLLLAITHELTRAYRSSRPDKAKIIGGRRKSDVYPGLDPAQSYVGFNGNGSSRRQWLRGYGYRLIGSTGKGWLHKAGYSVPEEARGRWMAVGKFLKDLDALVARFGLVVAAWHQEKAEWKPLAELRRMVNNLEGRRWLNKCVLRIYTTADYLVRWRRHFAEQMGFTHIPGGEPGPAAVTAQSSGTPAIRSGLDLDQWMRKEKLTNKQLAEKLEVTEAWVSYQRSGKKAWSKRFQQKLEALQAGTSRGQEEE